MPKSFASGFPLLARLSVTLSVLVLPAASACESAAQFFAPWEPGLDRISIDETEKNTDAFLFCPRPSKIKAVGVVKLDKWNPGVLMAWMLPLVLK